MHWKIFSVLYIIESLRLSAGHTFKAMKYVGLASLLWYFLGEIFNDNYTLRLFLSTLINDIADVVNWVPKI